MVVWNEALAYSTVKIVIVKDKRLGCLHYSFLSVIMAYIVGFVLLYSKEYLRVESPDGSVRVGLFPPAECGQADICQGYQKPSGELPYCSTGGGGVISPPRDCVYADDKFAVWPGIEQRGVLAATRVIEQYQTLPEGCDPAPGSPLPGPECYEWQCGTPAGGPAQSCSTCTDEAAQTDGCQSTSYVAQIEDFTAFIDHTVTAPALGVSLSYQSPKLINRGIFDSDGKQIEPCDDYQVASGGVCPGVEYPVYPI